MSNETGGKIEWAQTYSAKIGIDHAIGYSFTVTGQASKHGNWFVREDVIANKLHDFVFNINGEAFEMTGVEMLEALRTFKERKESGVREVCAEVDRAIAILSRKDDE